MADKIIIIRKDNQANVVIQEDGDMFTTVVDGRLFGAVAMFLHKLCGETNLKGFLDGFDRGKQYVEENPDKSVGDTIQGLMHELKYHADQPTPIGLSVDVPILNQE